MKIIVDMMGGDNAPLAPLAGAALAIQEYGVEILAVGNEEVLRKAAAEQNISTAGMTFVHCTETIEMCDEPALAVRRKKNSSIVVAMNLLKDGTGDAFVSAGSTGAVHVAASLILRTLPNVKRPALAIIVPSSKQPYLLMDGGANVECRAEMFATFAVMGSCYMNKVQGIANPTVALANNGVEESKGPELYRNAHQLLKKTPGIQFIGNIEPRDVPYAKADVVVCDGFTGNVFLKLTEGVAGMLMGMLKDIFKANLAGNIAYFLVKKGMGNLKSLMDSEAHGGAPLLGARKTVIKAHGCSEAYGIKNAIRQAKTCVESDLCGTMETALLEMTPAAE
ncbi:MAG: phosphate acyltransferase PlsX [Faecalibacterium sp.]